MGLIVGLGGEQKYKIGKVNYVVTSSFLPPKEKVGLKDRMARVIRVAAFKELPTAQKNNQVDCQKA